MYTEVGTKPHLFVPILIIALLCGFIHFGLIPLILIIAFIIAGFSEDLDSIEIEDFKLAFTYSATFRPMRHVEYDIVNIRTESETAERIFGLTPVMVLKIYNGNEQLRKIKSDKDGPTIAYLQKLELHIAEEIKRYSNRHLINESKQEPEADAAHIILPIAEDEEEYYDEDAEQYANPIELESRFIAAYNNYLLSFPYYGPKDMAYANKEWIPCEDITISVGTNYTFSRSARLRGLSFNIPVLYEAGMRNLCRLASNETEDAVYMLDNETGQVMILATDLNGSQRCAATGESFLLAQIEALNFAALKQTHPERLTEAYILSVKQKATAIAGGADYSEYYEWYIPSCITE